MRHSVEPLKRYLSSTPHIDVPSKGLFCHVRGIILNHENVTSAERGILFNHRRDLCHVRRIVLNQEKRYLRSTRHTDEPSKGLFC